MTKIETKKVKIGHRPLGWRKIKTAKELEDKIEKYFNQCKIEKKIPVMAGLARAVGVDRTTIINYSRDDAYFDTIKKAKVYLEACVEDNLVNRKDGSVTGLIFNLKNNYNWNDKQETEYSGSVGLDLANQIQEAEKRRSE